VRVSDLSEYLLRNFTHSRDLIGANRLKSQRATCRLYDFFQHLDGILIDLSAWRSVRLVAVTNRTNDEGF
jgi:hypothetical protein